MEKIKINKHKKDELNLKPHKNSVILQSIGTILCIIILSITYTLGDYGWTLLFGLLASAGWLEVIIEKTQIIRDIEKHIGELK